MATAAAIRFFELNTGAKIPSFGYGTWQSDPGVVADAVTTAVKVFVFVFIYVNSSRAVSSINLYDS